MMEIQALTYNDLAPVMPISGVIPQEGGTIGRGPQNAIVLPDPMRLVSRQHLQILPESKGKYRLVNISGANLVYVNSGELAPGTGCTVQSGDKIYVGGYVLLISASSRQFGGAANNGDVDAAGAAAECRRMAENTDDFIAALMGEGKEMPNNHPIEQASGLTADDSLEVFMHPAAARSPDSLDLLESEGIDLRSLTEKGDALINSTDLRDHSEELVKNPRSESIDSLLGANSLDPLAFFGGEREVSFGGDVLNALKTGGEVSVSPGAPTSRMNHGSELDGLFKTPEFTNATPKPAEKVIVPDDFDAFLSDFGQETRASAAAAVSTSVVKGELTEAEYNSPPLPSPVISQKSSQQVETPASPDTFHGLNNQNPLDDILSARHNEPVDETGRRYSDAELAFGVTHGETSSVSASQQQPTSAPLAVTLEPKGELEVLPPAQQATESVLSPSTVAAQPSVNAVDADLYHALLKGLGLKEIPDRTRLDADFMYLIGQLLRCTSQGTVDLMAGRAVVKREVRANVTLIAPERNNPLKFSPDGEVALMYLLGRTYPGFMGPAEAMSSAYLDLRAHQIGLVSGMRSALNHVLDKFDPAGIDNENVKKGILDGLNLGRKARLWDAYGRYYQATRDEAQDRFQEFFGAAFLKAYEEATESLQSSPGVQGDQGGAG